MPTEWNPHEARDPATSQPYTRQGAWERVHRELMAGCTLSIVALKKPPGKTGYAFHFHDAAGQRIYVKLQVLSGFVMGRSFHQG